MKILLIKNKVFVIFLAIILVLGNCNMLSYAIYSSDSKIILPTPTTTISAFVSNGWIITSKGAILTSGSIQRMKPSPSESEFPQSVPYYHKQNTVVLMYHNILSPGDTSIYQNTSVNTSIIQFENAIITLLENGYKPLSLNDLYENKNIDDGSKYFVITFDDGYKSNYELAFPVLLYHNVPADIFVNSNIEQVHFTFSFAQINEMISTKMIFIHSHFERHINVANLKENEFLDGINASFKMINENIYQPKYNFFAYPYGYYTKKQYNAGINQGLKFQLVQKNIISQKPTNLIVRTNVYHNANILELVKNAHYNWR